MLIVIYLDQRAYEGDPSSLWPGGEREINRTAASRPSRRDCNSAGLGEQASGFEDLRGYNVNEDANWPGVRTEAQRTDRRLPARLWVVVGTAIAAAGLAWLAYSYRESDAAIKPPKHFRK
jgi:hypothetical protein